MILTGHLIGIIAMAIMIIAVLTIGTLAAAGILERSPRPGRPDRRGLRRWRPRRRG